MNFDLIDYCKEKLWLTRSRDLPWWKRIFVNTVRVIILTARRFIQNQCTLKASALTFYTLFSIVPILALIFGIAKGFGLEKMLEQKIQSFASDYPAMAEKIINFADTMLRNARGGVVAGIGVLLLIWSAIKLMGSIEANLNEIWGVKQGRTLIRKVTDYAAILIICPILLLTAGSGVVFAAAKMDNIINAMPGGEHVGALIRLGQGFFPLLITWLVFTFIYVTIPNTKVKLKGALLAGLAAGYLSDRFDPGKTALSMAGIAALLLLSVAFTPCMAYLVLTRTLANFAVDCIEPSLQVWLCRKVSLAARNIAFAWAQSIRSIGGFVSPLAAGLVVKCFGLRPLFVGSACIFLLVMLLCILLYRKERSHSQHHHHPAGNPVCRS